jgi:glycosyltransferase involved in cell wall biosynthesis
MKPQTFLAAVGDSNSPVTWSGIPYHFLQAARAQGLIDAGLPLSTDGLIWKARRIKWNLGRVLSGDRRGGYQYSRSFLESLWSPVLPGLKGNVVINCFQLYAPSVIKDRTIDKWFFIDQTLLQLFDYYDSRRFIGRRIAREAIEREREGYHAASGMIVHSKWAAESVIRDYGVPSNHVHVVLPGANLDPIEYAKWELEEVEERGLEDDKKQRPLQLIFVGKYWKRKGLDRLLSALAIARLSGLKATLKVIGCRREDLPDHLRSVGGVEWLDFIDKRADASRFFRTLAECDVGCLLSRAEAGGIALREYHAFGLVVLGPKTGGAPEQMIQDASIAIAPEATDEEIADTLLNLERDSPWFNKLRSTAWQQRHSALWDESVRQIAQIWKRDVKESIDNDSLVSVVS